MTRKSKVGTSRIPAAVLRLHSSDVEVELHYRLPVHTPIRLDPEQGSAVNHGVSANEMQASVPASVSSADGEETAAGSQLTLFTLSVCSASVQ